MIRWHCTQLSKCLGQSYEIYVALALLNNLYSVTFSSEMEFSPAYRIFLDTESKKKKPFLYIPNRKDFNAGDAALENY